MNIDWWGIMWPSFVHGLGVLANSLLTAFLANPWPWLGFAVVIVLVRFVPARRRRRS